MLKSDLTRNKVGKVNVMNRKIEITEDTVGDNPGGRKFMRKTSEIMMESRRVSVKG